MIRKAFVMQVNPDAHEEYQRRHNPIWPELEAVLKSHGAHNYAIYLDKARNLLFATVEIESEERWNAVASTDVCQRWWKYMTDVGNDSNLLIVFYVQIMPDDFVMQLHRF
ncbi:L-rhamnose mutarotase [Escherichia coli]